MDVKTLKELQCFEDFSVVMFNIMDQTPCIIRCNNNNEYLLNSLGTYNKIQQQNSQRDCSNNSQTIKIMPHEAQEPTTAFNIAQSIIGSFDTSAYVRLTNDQFKLCMQSYIDTDLSVNENEENILIIVFEDESQLQHILI